MGRIQFTHTYEDIISVENLLAAWQGFRRGKQTRTDVQEFERNLMHHIRTLHGELASGVYRHSPYEAFSITDPKPRDIHKAAVRDRLLHHALHRKLYPFFNHTFISDSYSCRIGKGVHRAFWQFTAYARKASLNHTKTAWALKCDIRKFFANINHEILFSVLAVYIPDAEILTLLKNIVGSFSTPPLHLPLGEGEGERKKGLPLGNLTSQLLVNVYMNEFDQFVKHKLKVKYYIRYADDFVILSQNRDYLLSLIPHVRTFLADILHLELHPDKIFLKTLASGADFLGWVHFPAHRVLRTATKRRMFRRLQGMPSDASVASYLGLLKHGNTQKLQQWVEDTVSSSDT